MSDMWRVFTTQQLAQEYSDTCWAGLCYLASLDRIYEEDKSKKPTKPAAQMTKAEIAAVVDVAIKSLNHLGEPVNGADSTAWAVPKITKDGKWAVPCPDEDVLPGRVTEPIWLIVEIVGP